MLTMLSGFAAHEREVIRERSVAGTNRVAESGAWMGGIVPFGYRQIRAARARGGISLGRFLGNPLVDLVDLAVDDPQEGRLASELLLEGRVRFKQGLHHILRALIRPEVVFPVPRHIEQVRDKFAAYPLVKCRHVGRRENAPNVFVFEAIKIVAVECIGHDLLDKGFAILFRQNATLVELDGETNLRAGIEGEAGGDSPIRHPYAPPSQTSG
jgi:hypothetical protein